MAQRVKSRKAQASRNYQMVEVTDLTGGVDLRRAPSLLAPDRARTLRNFALTSPGELVIVSETQSSPHAARHGWRVSCGAQQHDTWA